MQLSPLVNTPSSAYPEHQRLKFVYLLLFSACLGILLFFSDPFIHLNFDGNTAYSDFSKNIFEKNTSYFAESILLPLLAKVVGASSSLHADKIFCSILIILILPILSSAAYQYFGRISLALVFIICLSAGFSYFRLAGLGQPHPLLGQPDPLTIMLLMLASLQRHPVWLFMFLLGAALSHFSLVLVAMPTIIAFIITTQCLTRSEKIRFTKFAILALLVGKLFLLTWYFIFEYQLGTRLDWISERWPNFFTQRYSDDKSGFWLAPTATLLLAYLAAGLYFCVLRRWFFFAAIVIALLSAYLASFITIDGFRIIAVVLAAPTVFIIKEILSINRQALEKLAHATYNTVIVRSCAVFYNCWFEIVFALIGTSVWLYLLKLASREGLLINGVVPWSLFSYTFDPVVALLSLAAIFILLVASAVTIQTKVPVGFAKFAFFLPIFLVILQYFRRLFFFNEALSTSGKILVLIYFLIAILLIVRLPLAPLTSQIKIRLQRFFT
jgi:hypothetical protein